MTDHATTRYVGRFAPSPTGPLHFGSLVAAVASFCDARAVGGRWLLRIDDVDTPRCVPGAAEDMLATLARFGLEWDGEPVWQSRRTANYRAAFEGLLQAGHVFGCACTRRELADSTLAPDGSRVYPGTCRDGLPPGREARAWRVRVAGCVEFDDAVQGRQHAKLDEEVGDFVVLRADGLFAYQLAAVVDDLDAGVTDIVRGADLLASSVRQIHLQNLLGAPRPRYAHVPVALDAAGEKLSKQTLARAIDECAPGEALHAALAFLGQNPPQELATASPERVLDWAVAHWQLDGVPRRLGARAPHALAAQ